ncbi:MAG: alginate export family protein [bacterium]|nr:alginate export family protein [bacterium]
MRYNILKISITVFSLLVLTGTAFAQDLKSVAMADQFYPDFKADSDMKPIMPGKSFSTRGIQFGGWITPSIITDTSSSSTSAVLTAKLWAKSYLWENSYIYVRGKDVVYLVIDGTSDHTNHIDLDVAYITMTTSGRSLRLSIGRKYFLLGSGVLFNDRGDGAELNFYSKYINLKVFGAYSGLFQTSYNSYNLSTQDDSDGAKRVFAGGTLSQTFANQTISLLGMAQFDFADESSGSVRYQSQYYGIGVQGTLFDNLTYSGEFIYEMGTSYDATSVKKNIRAYAATANLNYYFDMTLKPTLMAQYAFGSGDSDKVDHGSPTGNISGNDNGFLAFGTFVGGYALRPILSNIHIMRAGFSLLPLSWMDSLFFRRMTIIAKYNVYLKDKKEQGIADSDSYEATESNIFVGHGSDIAFRWKLFSDLSVFANYGFFLPGSAYASGESMRHFVLGGLTLSF